MFSLKLLTHILMKKLSFFYIIQCVFFIQLNHNLGPLLCAERTKRYIKDWPNIPPLQTFESV